MEIVSAAESVSRAVGALAEFVQEETSLSRRVRNDIVSLQLDLEWLQAILDDGHKDPLASATERFKMLEHHIGEISRRVTDEIWCFSKGGEGESSGSSILDHARKPLQKVKGQSRLHDFFGRFESLKNEMQSIFSKARDFSNTIKPLPQASADINRQEPGNQETVIGLEDVKRAILEQLMQEEASRLIISVCGMGGLGKSTLVHELYNSTAVSDRFPVPAWVSGSPTYQIVLSTFARNFRIRTGSDMPREVLDEQRYLLVIDDIRHSNIDALRQLWAVLPDNNKGSRVIITTRNKAVALRASRHQDFIHELRFMTEDESWELFQLKFGRQMVQAEEERAREMVRKCGGLPLAITTLADVLIQRMDPRTWREISDLLWNRLMKEDERNISGLLWDPSNSEFSRQIRPHFLYMGMFPEGYEFNLEKLISLWMAEGFIEDGQDTMDFRENLVNCSLVQVVGTIWEETLTVRVVHDLLRFLAVQEARKRNFFAIFPYKKDGTRGLSLSKRHAIHSQFGEYIRNTYPDLRTLISLCRKEPDFKIKKLVSRSKDFGSLLVLDLMGINFSRRYMFLGDHLSILINNLSSTLRFLGLTNTSITKIPASIGNLVNLDTLEALGQEIILLPEDISKLKRLRHLRGKFYVTHIETLKALETFCVLCINSSLRLDLRRLANLQELSVHFSMGPSSLDFISGLGALSISSPHPLPTCANLEKLWLDGPIMTIPNVDQFPPHLRRLILSGTGFNDDPMPTLGQLPNLETLELIRSCTCDVISCPVDGFTRLQVLRLSNMATLKELRVQQGAMPRLNGLRIDGCRQDLIVPDWLSRVPRFGKSAIEERIQQIRI